MITVPAERTTHIHIVYRHWQCLLHVCVSMTLILLLRKLKTIT